MNMTEIPTLTRRKKKKAESSSRHASVGKRPSVGADLHHLDADRVIKTDPVENRHRRTLLLTKRDNSWGFTLQSYGIKHKKTDELEVMTYVDYVDIEGPACVAGMRRGDVILSINGEKVGDVTHQELVSRIRQTGTQMRLVVLFEDCCRKVDLHDRYLKLKAVLKSKYDELKQLELKEMNILEAYYEMKGWNRFEHLRQSILSRDSTSSDSWDAYSLVSSPYNQHSTGHFDQWPSVSSLKSFNIGGDDSSNYEESYLEYIDTESESTGSCSNLSLSTGELGMGKSRKSDSDLVTKYGGHFEIHSKNTHMSKSSIALNRHMTGVSSAVARKEVRRVSVELAKSLHSLTDEVFISQNQTTEQEDGAKMGPGLRKVDSLKKSFPRKDQVFYSGENGKIIVPKICIEGKEVYTTFDDIDITNETEDNRTNPPDSEKNVALDFARQMALIEQLNLSSDDNSETSKTNSKTLPKKLMSTRSEPITFRERGATWGNEKRQKKVELRREILHNGREFRSASNLTDNSTHLCGALSYEQLKTSVPDFYLPFHLARCQIVYINEHSETTEL